MCTLLWGVFSCFVHAKLSPEEIEMCLRDIFFYIHSDNMDLLYFFNINKEWNNLANCLTRHFNYSARLYSKLSFFFFEDVSFFMWIKISIIGLHTLNCVLCKLHKCLFMLLKQKCRMYFNDSCTSCKYWQKLKES